MVLPTPAKVHAEARGPPRPVALPARHRRGPETLRTHRARLRAQIVDVSADICRCRSRVVSYQAVLGLVRCGAVLRRSTAARGGPGGGLAQSYRRLENNGGSHHFYPP